MSTIIEQAARSLKGALPGVGSSGEANARQDARGKDLIRQMAVGGLALGGGASAAVALVNYLKSMREENEVEDESRLNDDTLYIPAPRTKEASDVNVNRWVAPGLAVTGGILSAGGAYAITQAIYSALQRKHRQKMLDEAQNETLAAADLEVQKSASSMTFSDLVTAFPVAVPLLAALASGGIAYTALNKTFPTVKNPKSKFPKRIRQVAADGEMTELPGPQTKAASLASLWAERDCEDAGLEYLALLTDRVAMEKGAMCITSDILNRVAREGTAELSGVVRDHGLATLCEITKGASARPVTDGEKAMAAAAIFKSARLSSVVGTIAAAEFADMLPHISAACSGMEPEHLEKLAGLGALMHMSWHRPEMIKAAAAMEGTNPLLMELVAMLKGAPQQPITAGATDLEEEERDAALTSDVSGSMAEDSEGGGEELPSDDGEEDESQASDDVIDSFMAAPSSAPPPKA